MSTNTPFDSGDPNPYEPPPADIALGKPIAGDAAAIAGLGGTKVGLQMIYYAIVAILLTIILGIAGGVTMAVLGRGGGAAVPVAAGMAMVAAVIVILIASVAMFVGQCFCLSVPTAVGARGLIVAAVGLQAFNLLLSLGVGIASAVLNAGPAPPNPIVLGMQLLNAVLGIVAFFCFLAFIRKVAMFIDRPDQSAYAGKVITVFASIVGLYVLMAGVFVAMAVGGGAVGQGAAGVGMAAGCSGLVILVLAIALLCMYTTLLRTMARAIGDRMAKGAPV